MNVYYFHHQADELLGTASEQFLGKSVKEIKQTILQTLEGHLRAILGKCIYVCSVMVCLNGSQKIISKLIQWMLNQVFEAKVYLRPSWILFGWRKKKEHQNRNANMSYYVSDINKELSDSLCNMGSVYVDRKKSGKNSLVPTARSKYLMHVE